MTFKTAQESFETALHFAQTDSNPATEHVAAGLLELTKAIEAELVRMKTEMDSIEKKINQPR